MKIEDYRNENIGRIYFEINSEKIVLQHYNLIFYIFPQIAQLLHKLENPKKDFVFTNNTESLNCVCLLFMSVEAFFNDILKLFCVAKEERFSDYKTKPISERVKAIFKLSETDKQEFYKSGIYQELQEFEHLRNIIFHNGYDENIKFKKTLFSSIPINCNIVDVMQALKIDLRIFEYFRFLIKDIDMMPNIFINPLNNAFWEKCDIVYAKFFIPYFLNILKKHNLKTELDLNYTNLRIEESGIIKNNQVHVIIKAEKYTECIEYNKEITNCGNILYNKLTDGNIVEPNKFRLPNYYR